MSIERTDRLRQRRSRMLRWGILGTVLVAITGVVTAHQLVSGSGKPASVDFLCPFGGVETLWSLVSGAGFVEKTAASGVVLLVGVVVLALVMRRSFCGQICPLGTLQGLFGSIGGRLFKKSPQMPKWIDRPARLIKYVVLIGFTVWTWQAASLVMRPYDPWAAYAHLTSSELLTDLGAGLAVLAVSLVGSLVYERFFCKYLCPTGAMLGLFSRLSFFGIKRDSSTCTNCKACDKACPMNIEVSSASSVKSSECISCNECVNACPAAGALEVKRVGGKRVSPTMTTGIVAALMVAIIGIGSAAGYFAWTMPSLDQAVRQQQKLGGSTSFDPALIKGYMSMAEISRATGISGAEFMEKWGVSEADLAKPMKEIKDAYGFSPDDVRVWVEEKLAK